MYKYLTIILISSSFAAEINLGIIPKKLRRYPTISDFIEEYNKPKSVYKNVYLFKKDSIEVTVFINDQKYVTKAQYNFYRSKITSHSLKEELRQFKKIEQEGHERGRYLLYKDKNETIRFYNNQSQNLSDYEVIWPK